MTAQHDTLVIALEAAVPLHIIEMGRLTPEQRQRVALRSAGEVASRGDILQFRGGKRGETAAVFNHLARGLACLAFQPGGVTFAGHHWCTDHAVCEGAEAAPVSELQPKPADCRRSIVDLELPA